jgi:hypothetical protein
VSHLAPHLAAPIAVVAALGVFAIRLVFKTLKLGLLVAAPALLYVLHH